MIQKCLRENLEHVKWNRIDCFVTLLKNSKWIKLFCKLQVSDDIAKFFPISGNSKCLNHVKYLKTQEDVSKINFTKAKKIVIWGKKGFVRVIFCEILSKN